MFFGWGEAVGYCEKLADGQGGLSDGSHAGDWRLPTAKELQSLINYGTESPCLPAGHPFVQAQSICYWSGTVCADHPNNAWRVHLCDGLVDFGSKDNRHYVWPVRFADR
ncbi:MAG: DUF1566 domain-containing protein [Deltaproteobacteria bacterium]|nr:DUF1566 domain-containing protein [Deltaproteobacteria bacterium]